MESHSESAADAPADSKSSTREHKKRVKKSSKEPTTREKIAPKNDSESKHSKKLKNGKKSKKAKKSKKSKHDDEDEVDSSVSVADLKRAAFLKTADKSTLVPDDEKVQLSWENIHYQVPEEKRRFARCRGYGPLKTILNKVTGYVKPGEMVAIIGPSGAGKTSLLNCLSRRIKPGTKPSKTLTGKILLNGEQPDTDEFHAISGFVAQDDILMGTSTAIEALNFAADCTIGDVSQEERDRRVNNLISMMGLESCKNNFIGFTGQGAANSGITRGLSGGERKRLSVCVELIHNPRILFCDEPTSGLDSFAATTVIQSLQKLAFTGRTIMCTIHQPSTSVFNMFDKVLVLTGGNVCYFGPPQKALGYFKSIGYPAPKHVNPADYLLQVVQAPITKGKEDEVRDLTDITKSTESLKEIITAYNNSQVAKDAANPPTPPALVAKYAREPTCANGSYAVSYARQFALLSHRSWLGILREPMLFRARLLQSLFMALLAGLIYLRLAYDQTGLSDRISGGFFIIISAMFGGINGPTYLFPAERGVYYREKAAGMYSGSMYFLAKVFTQLPVNLAAPAILATIGWWMIGFNDNFGNFLIFLLVALLVNNLGFSLGLLLSTAILDPAMVQRVQPLILLPFMLFGGFFLSADSIPVYFQWIEYMSFVKYAFRIAMNVVLKDTAFWCQAKDFRDSFFVAVPLNMTLDSNVSVSLAPTSIPICPITSGTQMMDAMSLTYDEDWGGWGTDFAILCGMYVFFTFMSWVFIRFRNPKF
eukprot:TRINITY_DN95_c1_g1_i1.p1 TRINITY_DN95_c1_g1~~TRINITY_DN95_c1_g1_i1.p1  ORF type:complete len:782 (-),score=142.23 TRINITY_DN95_c1_g1_i1:59-2344(-)